ncbi:hypothetical protein KAU19_06225 [Candidatus Parcubacteria bacterium]|jgi:hypothetical protein|nr:hypothetical protein [Candidatus Parcubacteria bacterium]
MQLVIYCKKCSKRNVLNIRASDRVELKMKYGSAINITCKKCNAINKYEADNIKAEQRFSSLVVFIALVSFTVILICFLWDYNWHKFGSVFLIPVGLLILVSIYAVIIKEIMIKVKDFNKS